MVIYKVMLEKQLINPSSHSNILDSMNLLNRSIERIVNPIGYIKKYGTFSLRVTVDSFPSCWDSSLDDSDKIDILSQQNILLHQEILNIRWGLRYTRQPFYYSSSTNTLLLLDSDWTAVSFMTKGGDKNMIILMEILLEAIERDGWYEHNFMVVSIEQNKIIKRAQEKGIPHADKNWVKRTKSNIMNNKLNLHQRELVQISNYDPNIGGYYFRIKLPAACLPIA